MTKKTKQLTRANRLVAQLARSVANHDCGPASAKLIKRTEAAFIRAAGSVKRLGYAPPPGYGRFLHLEAQRQVSCRRGGKR
jgi:hypothetical protein